MTDAVNNVMNSTSDTMNLVLDLRTLLRTIPDRHLRRDFIAPNKNFGEVCLLGEVCNMHRLPPIPRVRYDWIFETYRFCPHYDKIDDIISGTDGTILSVVPRVLVNFGELFTFSHVGC